MVGGFEGPHQDCPKALMLLVTCVPIWPALLAAVETCAGSYGIGHFCHSAAAWCAWHRDSRGTGAWCAWAGSRMAWQSCSSVAGPHAVLCWLASGG